MSKIYHYTTIDTLALIMLNKTIRFNRLDRVDDKEESIFGSGPFDTKVSKNVFVSCWTRNPEENHDLWQRYTRGNKGVRIALDEDMFQTYQINEHFKSFFPDWFKIIEDCLFPLPFNEAKLYDVQYVENNEELIRRCANYENNYVNIKIHELGIYKKKEDWKQQEESRFKLFALPSTTEASIKNKSHTVNDMMAAMDTVNTLLMSNHQIGLEYFDMPLKKGVLNSIEVTMGPNTDDDDKAKVRCILYRCTLFRLFSNQKIKDSCLKK